MLKIREWVWKPISFGLDNVNFAVVQIVTLFLNQYGSRLLKINGDIIREHKCESERNNFYFYQINLNRMEQEINGNLFAADDIVVDGLVLSIPWKNILTEITDININNISLVAKMIDNTDSMYYSFMETSNPFMKSHNGEEVKSPPDIIFVFNEIKNLLMQYFQKLHLYIDTLNITLHNHFTLVIKGISVDNELLVIDNIKLMDLNERILGSFDRLTYNFKNKHVSLENVEIFTHFVYVLPNFRFSDEKSSLELSVMIDLLKIDELIIRNMEVMISPEKCHVDYFGSFKLYCDDHDVFEIELINHSSPESFITWDVINNTVFWNNCLSVIISDMAEKKYIEDFVEKMIKTKNLLMEKLGGSKVPKHESQQKIIIQNIQLKIDLKVEGIIDVNVSKLCIGKIIKLQEIFVSFQDYTLNIDLLLFSDIGKYLVIQNTKMTFLECFIYFQRLKISWFGDNNALLIDIHHIKLSNLHNLLNRFQKYEKHIFSSNHESTRQIKCILHEADINIKTAQLDFNVIVSESQIDFTNKCINKLILDVFSSGALIVRLDATHLSSSRLIFNRVQFFLDPEMYDYLTYLARIMGSDLKRSIDKSKYEDNVNLDLLKDAIEGSIEFSGIQSNNFEDFERMMEKSFQDIAEEVPIVIKIESLQIYLFNKLSFYNDKQKQPAITCFILKEVQLIIKKSEYILECNNGALIDCQSMKHEWKYLIIKDNESKEPFLILSYQTVDGHVSDVEKEVRMTLKLAPIIASIREETLIKIMKFFTDTYDILDIEPMPPIYFQFVHIHKINVRLNYYPSIIRDIAPDPNILTIYNYKFSLPENKIVGIVGTDRLMHTLLIDWKKVFNPDSIISFLPNIKIIQPYTKTLGRAYKIIGSYLEIMGKKTGLKSYTNEVKSGINKGINTLSYGVSNFYRLLK